jgi:hypothetical protein
MAAHTAAASAVTWPEMKELEKSWAARPRKPKEREKQREMMSALARQQERQSEVRKVTRELHALLEQQQGGVLELAAAEHGHIVIDDARRTLLEKQFGDEGRRRYLQQRIEEKKKELTQLDPRHPAFPTETKIRREIATRLGVSKGTVIDLAKRTGRIAKKPER